MADPSPWWRNSVVYQIYPRSFADSDGDGVGDLRGILSKVGHLVDLGVDVVWLSPIYASPHDDNGYDISDYQAVDPLFGTLEDLDELVKALHDSGIRLMMDLVVNHTSDEHPWFLESRSSRDNPKRDWYWWRPRRDATQDGEGAEPTNWASSFGGPAWELDEATAEYYLHLFSRKQPDLNWENPQVRHAVYAMMRWWLDRGVDGFRMDVINMISKVTALPNGAPSTAGRSQPALADGAPFFFNGPRLHEYLQEMHLQVLGDHPTAVLTVGETPATTVDAARLMTDPARHELDMVFQFEHVDLDHGATKWDERPLLLTDLKASLDRWQTGLAEVGWNSLYWNNHDQPRAVSRFGDDSAEHWFHSATTLATVLHLHRGTPYVYQGEEIGMTNAAFARVEDFRDIESLNHYRAAVASGDDPDAVVAAMGRVSRDNARTPVQWDATPGAGFSTGEPWIPLNPNHIEINVAAQRGDDGSVLAHYRRLIRLRKDEPAIVDGTFSMLLPDDPQLYVFLRTTPSTELLVLASFSRETVVLDLGADVGDWTGADVLLPNYRSGDQEADAATVATRGAAGAGEVAGAARHGVPSELRPWESLVLRRRVVGG